MVVVGSGPGGIQAAYFLSRLGIRHAVISADPTPGGMFRRFPFFQRLLSWTKPNAPFPRGTREYEWYDFNSLLSIEPENRAIMPELMDGTSEFPSRPEMEAGIRTFAERAGVAVRYETRWESTGRDGDRFVLRTSDGDYRCDVAIFAVGVAEPWMPSSPGFEYVSHYIHTRDAETYRGKRLFIVGKQNSGFELASGLLQWASRIILASPRPATLSVNAHSLAGVRARYVQPWEDSNLGGGCFILNASIERVERDGDGFTVHTRRSDNSEPFAAHVDEVIAATGFQCPLMDLPDLGVNVFGQSRLPTMTNSLRKRHGPGDLLRGHDRPGRGRAQEVRDPGELGRRARCPVQHAADGAARGRDEDSGCSASGRPFQARRSSTTCWRRQRSRRSCGTRSRISRERCGAMPTERSETRGSCRSPTLSTRAAPTVWRSRWRRTRRAIFIRLSTCADTAGSTRMRGSTPAPFTNTGRRLTEGSCGR